MGNEDDFQSSGPSFGGFGSRKRHLQPRLSSLTVCCSSPLLSLSAGQCHRIQYSEQKRWLPDWVICSTGLANLVLAWPSEEALFSLLFSTSTEDTELSFSTGSKVSRRMLLERGLTL